MEEQREIDKEFIESIDNRVFKDISEIIQNNDVIILSKDLKINPKKIKLDTIFFVNIDNWNCFVVEENRILWYDPQEESCENDLQLLMNMHEYKSEEDEDYEYSEESTDEYEFDSEYESSERDEIDIKQIIAEIFNKELHIIKTAKSKDKFHKLWVLLFAYCYDNKEMDRFMELSYKKHRTKIIKHWTYNTLKKLEYNEEEFKESLSNMIFNSEVQSINITKFNNIIKFLENYSD